MADENQVPKDEHAAGKGRDDAGTHEVDPFHRPSDLPPAEDPDLDEIGALVGASSPGLRRVEAEPGHADDAKLDLWALARASAPGAQPAEPSPEPAPAVPSARGATESPESEIYVPRSGPPGWLLGLLAGVGLGFGAGALVFRTSPDTALAAVGPAAAAVAPPPPSAPVPPPLAAAPMPAPQPAPPRAEPLEAGAGAAPAPVPSHVAPAPLAADAPSTKPAPLAPIAAYDARSTGAVPRAADALDPGPVPTLLRADDEAEVRPSGPRTMDNLLDQALSPEARRQEEEERRAAASRATIPATPSREQVEEAMAVLRPAIRGCAMGQSGLATADIVVRSDGSVAGVQVTGAPFAGTASGRCMEGVARRAKFPPFQKPTFHVRFPFAIQ